MQLNCIFYDIFIPVGNAEFLLEKKKKKLKLDIEDAIKLFRHFQFTKNSS